MSRRAYMPLFVGDYLADTLHLSTREHGAYLLLIMHYWQSGKPLPDDDARLARILRMTIHEWESIRPVLEPFFDVHSGCWHHGRIQKELSHMAARSEVQRLKGIKSGEARRDKTTNHGSTGVQPVLNHGSTGVEPPNQTKPNHTKPEEDAALLACAREGLDGLEAKLRSAAGAENDPSPGLYDTSPISRLMVEGFDLDREIIPVIRARAASMGRPARSWGYYVAPIRESRETRAPPASLPMNRRQQSSMDDIVAYAASQGVKVE